jgi:hypothetical protein
MCPRREKNGTIVAFVTAAKDGLTATGEAIILVN